MSRTIWYGTKKLEKKKKRKEKQKLKVRDLAKGFSQEPNLTT